VWLCDGLKEFGYLFLISLHPSHFGLEKYKDGNSRIKKKFQKDF